MRILVTLLAVILLNTTTMAHANEAAIRNALDAWEKAYNSGNADAVAALYTKDAALLPPDGSRIDGRAGVAKFWGGAIASGLANVDLMADEIEVYGDTATEVGRFQGTVPTDSGGTAPAYGKYIVIWKKAANGQWQLHRDIWNAGK